MQEERLTRLEEKLAHQEAHILSLNDTLYQQQTELAALRRRQEELLAQVEQLRNHPGTGSETGGEPPPPHY
ncbi:putative coiled-coil protein SlyX [Natronospira proteinivora]|uniref:Coiled-coil protein SlyX n=1 Tax=Natronospira proteinivora TaxID=1807133 RepID=A0ABT1G9X2_9GAMM|nr:SlyX family protein [Natronospira proteinivora]MCP1727842.1 putative coiled-coil protein SlyX [Natronospira proteinivora]